MLGKRQRFIWHRCSGFIVTKSLQHVWQTTVYLILWYGWSSIWCLVGGDFRPWMTLKLHMDKVMTGKSLWSSTSLPGLLLMPTFTAMFIPAHIVSTPTGPTGTGKQMEKIAVTQGPIAFCLHLFPGPAPETASCGGRVRSWKETSAALWISHHYSGWIKRGTLCSNKRKVRESKREEERVNEKVKPAVWKCLIFTTVQQRMLITASMFGHNQMLNLSLQEYQRCSAKVDFWGEGVWVKLLSCIYAFKIYMRCS